MYNREEYHWNQLFSHRLKDDYEMVGVEKKYSDNFIKAPNCYKLEILRKEKITANNVITNEIIRIG